MVCFACLGRPVWSKSYRRPLTRGRGHRLTGVTNVFLAFRVFRESQMTGLFCACRNTDVHTVASLLKLYLRQLPEPLVPYSHYQEFLFCGQKLLSERALVTVESLVFIPRTRLYSQPHHDVSLSLTWSPNRVWGSWGIFFASCRSQTSTCSTLSASKNSVTVVSTPQPAFSRNSAPDDGTTYNVFLHLCVQVFIWGPELLQQ